MGRILNEHEVIVALKELCKHYTPTKSTMHPHIDFVIEIIRSLSFDEEKLKENLEREKNDSRCSNSV